MPDAHYIDGYTRGDECLRGILEQRAHFRFHATDRIVEPGGHSIVFEHTVPGRRQFEPPRGIVPAIGSGQNIEPKLKVLDSARHGSRNGQVGKSQRSGRAGNLAVGGNNSVAGLVTGHAGHV